MKTPCSSSTVHYIPRPCCNDSALLGSDRYISESHVVFDIRTAQNFSLKIRHWVCLKDMYRYSVQVIHRYVSRVCSTGSTQVCGTCRCWIPDKEAPGAWLSWEPVKQVRAPGGAGQSRGRSSQETPPQGHRQTDYKHRTDNLTQLGQNGLKLLFQLWTSKTKRNSLVHLDKKKPLCI